MLYFLQQNVVISKQYNQLWMGESVSCLVLTVGWLQDSIFQFFFKCLVVFNLNYVVVKMLMAAYNFES